MIPLLTSTKKPIIYSTSSFGGDDCLGYYEMLLSDNDPYFDERNQIRRNYYNAIKNNNQSEATMIEDEYDIFKFGMMERVDKENQNEKHNEKVFKFNYQTTENENNRLNIVAALGGEDFCKTIPVINPKEISDYISFTIFDIPTDSSFAQYEDAAGRKGLLMKLENKKTGGLELIHCFQRYRETCIGSDFEPDGGMWLVCKGFSNNKLMENINEIVDFIHQIKSNLHELYQLSTSTDIRKYLDSLLSHNS